MGKYFGTDGFRGEANVGLTADQAFKVGKFLGYYFSKKPNGEKCKIVIGKDTRLSSYMFEYAIAAGIISTGADAYLLHVTTTPSISYVVRTEGFDLGIMITASHNQYIDNGIKLINSEGEKLSEDIILKIEDYLDGKIGGIPFALRENIGRNFDFIAGRNRYMGYLISIPMNSFKDRKIALDMANGSAYSLSKSIFDALGAKTFVINNEPNGNNINLNAGSTHIENLQKFVVENNCEVGFAYDGDADRCLAVDEEGNVVDGDKIMSICAKELKKKNQLKDNTIVTTIMSNLGLYKALDEIGIKYEITDVGDKNVRSLLKEKNYSFGGEQSGHIIFTRHSNVGDGILTSLKLMDYMIEEKKSLKELAKDISLFPQILKNVQVKNKDEMIANEDLQNLADKVKKELGNDGRLVLRKSGTENVIRIMIEAKTKEICEKNVDLIYEKIKELDN